MEYESVVRETASSLGLLDAHGKLKELDSMAIIDLVAALEQSTSIEIPTIELRAETFESVESIVEMLRGLAGGAK